MVVSMNEQLSLEVRTKLLKDRKEKLAAERGALDLEIQMIDRSLVELERDHKALLNMGG